MKKSFIIPVWIILIASFFFEGKIANALHILAFILLVIHVLEFFYYYKSIAKSKEPLAKNFLLVLIFGLFRVAEIKKELRNNKG